MSILKEIIASVPRGGRFGFLTEPDLRGNLEDFNVKIPRFDVFNQGSYAMGPGIEPLPGEDYDIDVGLNFHLSKNDYLPVQVKQRVYEALDTGNRKVEYKRPCVRVQYHRAGEEIYHG